MKTFYALLATVAVVMFLVYVVRLRSQMRRESRRKRDRREFLRREGERDRNACVAAAKALGSGSAPRDAFVLADPTSRGNSPSGENLAAAIHRRQRRATSTAFDPDLPAT